jgi:hypothetical protein
MSRTPMIVLPHEAAAKISASAAKWGNLRMSRIPADDLYVITAFQSGGNGAVLPVRPASGQERLRQEQAGRYTGQWHRVTPNVQWHHYLLERRPGTCISFDNFQKLLPRRVVLPGAGGMTLVVTHAPEVADLEQPNPMTVFAGWSVTRDEAWPCNLAVEPATHGLTQLAEHWPIDLLRNKKVLVVGAGSIGGFVASNLAGYGVGTLHLLDPDRLLWHNTVRHVLGDGEIGRFKTDALKDALEKRWPGLTVVSHVKDVVHDADQVRTLLTGVDAVVCAADGVAPRRVVSHLARRAGRDAILTSVLEDGAFGEVLRLRPAPDEGCLLCRRAPMYTSGQMDPERVQERGYGDGDPHRPMTAVGPDLAFMGNLAAKVTVATLVKRLGYNDQRLPGEQAIVALRPQPGFEAPFDLTRIGQVVWHPATPPLEGCFTCCPP